MKTNPEGSALASIGAVGSVEIAAKVCRKFFIEEMKADGGDKVAYGATIISRVQWALWLSLAVARVVALAPQLPLVDVLNACFASDLGNISQLTKELQKEGELHVATAANEAGSLSERLAKRAAQAAPVVSATPPPAV